MTKSAGTTITASTDGDEYHEAGEASYQITLVPGTGISTLTSEQAAGEWYTIQGVRVDKSAKGIYIYGNKKVVK